MSKKEYFTPVELPALEDLQPEPAPPETDEIPDIKDAIKVIRTEIGRMQDGTSDYRSGSLHLEKGQSPATIALDKLEKRPGKKNLVNFLVCARQDFGTRAAGFFKDEISKHYLEAQSLTNV